MDIFKVFIFYSFVWFFLSIAKAQFSSLHGCGPLITPRNAVIQGCSRGGREGSRCIIRCDYGFRPEQTIRFCTCIGIFCLWQGNNPTCDARRCPVPTNTNGKVTIVDKWSQGFAGVIEFGELSEDLVEGWSVLVVFDSSLGENVEIVSWSAEASATSFRKKAFTLTSPQRNGVPSVGRNNPFRTMFILNRITGEFPTSGFAGLYNRRVANATCYQPTSSLLNLYEMNSFSASTTSGSLIPQESLTTFTQPIASSIETTAVLTTTVTSSAPRQNTLSLETAASSAFTTSYTSDTSFSSTSSVVNESSSTKPPNPTSTSTTHPQLNEIDGMRCVFQRADGSYRTQKGWTDSTSAYFSGNAVVQVPGHQLNNWMIVIVFQRRILSMQVWNTVVLGNERDGVLWKLGPHTFNLQLHGGELDVNFIAEVPITASTENPIGQAYLCSLNFPYGDPIRLPNEDETFAPPGVSNFTYSILSTTPRTTTTTASRATATYNPDTSPRCRPSSPMGERPSKQAQSRPRWRRPTVKTKYNYFELLSKSIFFYEAQRSGFLPPSFKRVPWRGNSMLKDGCSVGVDLSRGWFDAGDYVKFTFPMASAVTTLAWGGIEFRSAYRSVGILTRFLGSIKWPVEYLIKAHLSDTELVALVGNVQADHGSWSRPEDWNQDRPVYTITADRPGSEMAAETAAALASSAILLKRTHARVAALALQHAKSIYEFAMRYRGDYHESVPEVSQYYRSHSGYTDELIWAAAWMYRATGNETYLEEAERIYVEEGGPYLTEQEYSWDQKMIGAQVLLANLTGKEIYRSGVVRFMNRMLTATSLTPQGMLWIRMHGPNRYAANAAMLAILAYGLQPPLPDRELYLTWARKQIHLLLGDAGRSYVVGFGHNYPKRPHHRASSCPRVPDSCGWNMFSVQTPNPFILYGALVGGPDKNGDYNDSRENYQQSEVAIDYNAGFQSAIAGLIYHVESEPRIGNTA